MRVREYNDQDLKEIIRIWNEVVEEGIAFPREDTLDMESGADFVWKTSIMRIYAHTTRNCEFLRWERHMQKVKEG